RRGEACLALRPAGDTSVALTNPPRRRRRLYKARLLGPAYQNRPFRAVSVLSSTFSSTSHTRSICPVVILLKNGRPSVRAETYSVIGKSPGLWPRDWTM